jgi:alpha-methylacyl-CoA racemase
MKRAFEARFKSKTQAEWRKIFDATDSCVVPVLDFKEAAEHPHNKAREVLITYGE